MAQKKQTKQKDVKLEATSNLSGKYLLPYSKGHTFSISEVQAQELIDNKDAKKA